MRDDPFAQLSGLDQKLFTANPPPTAKGQGAIRPTENTPNEPTKERPDGRPSVPTLGGTSGRTKDRPNGGTMGGTSQRTSGGSNGGTSGPAFVRPKVRMTQRRPYDFCVDQILWLNRMKLEIYERYRRRVTANAMVQLALDLLIQDHHARGERSQLITKLVLAAPLLRYQDQGAEEPPPEPTSGRSSEGE